MKMRYHIENLSDLHKALKECRPKDSIDGDGVVISAEEGLSILFIPHSLSLENIVFSNLVGQPDNTPSNPRALIWTAEDTELSMHDISMHYLDDAQGLSIPVHMFNKNCELRMTDCDIFGASLIGVYLQRCDRAYINYCTINMTSPTKWGYGIWQGGYSSPIDQVLNVSASKFNDCRHAIAGSYHENHIVIDQCEFRGNVKHVLDRHSGNPDPSAPQFGVGGGSYIVTRCTFYDTDRRPIDMPRPTGQNIIEITHNRFYKPYGSTCNIELNIDGVKSYYNERDLGRKEPWFHYKHNLTLEIED